MSEEQKLSTTRLAELAKMDVKQLFKLFDEQQWIERVDKQWCLTAKGEYQGGSYQQSDKYGQYIVWPASLVEHTLITDFEEEWLSSTRLGEQWQISARRVNLILSDLAWISRDQRGWVITDKGKQLGGEQRSGKQGFFVRWSGALKRNSEWQAAMENVVGTQCGTALDGHVMKNTAHQIIDNWLYLYGLTHAYQRKILASDYIATFYLPCRQVYVEYWGYDEAGEPLSERLDKQAYYKSQGLKLVELTDDDIASLDEVLPQRLLQFGIQL